MRFGLVVPMVPDLDALKRIAGAIDESAFEFACFFRGVAPSAWQDPIVGAEAIGALTSHTRVMIEVLPGLDHPLLLTESMASLDAAIAGRLEVLARPPSAAESHHYGHDPRDSSSRFSEATEILHRAWHSTPFDFQGDHWTIPGRLASNVLTGKSKVQITTRPNQVDLPLWVASRGVRHRFERVGRPAATRSLAQRLDLVDLNSAVTDIDRLAVAGVLIALVQFASGDLVSAMLAFSRSVAPRYHATDLPEVVVESMRNHANSTLG